MELVSNWCPTGVQDAISKMPMSWCLWILLASKSSSCHISHPVTMFLQSRGIVTESLRGTNYTCKKYTHIHTNHYKNIDVWAIFTPHDPRQILVCLLAFWSSWIRVGSWHNGSLGLLCPCVDDVEVVVFMSRESSFSLSLFVGCTLIETRDPNLGGCLILKTRVHWMCFG